MGYQESIIYTNRSNVEKNNEELSKILCIMIKYSICCEDDDANCVAKVHYNRKSGFFSKGMDTLVIAGERYRQRNYITLFELQEHGNKSLPLTEDERRLVSKLKFVPVEDVMGDIEQAEDNNWSFTSALLLVPVIPPNYFEVKEMVGKLAECYPDGYIAEEEKLTAIMQMTAIVESYGYTLSVESKSKQSRNEFTGDLTFYNSILINGYEIGVLMEGSWFEGTRINLIQPSFEKQIRLLANMLFDEQE